MSFVAAAVVSAGAMIGGQIMSSKSQGKAIKQAAATEAEAAQYAADLQKEAFDQQQATQRPFLTTGYQGNNMLQALAAGKPVTSLAPNYSVVTDPQVAAQAQDEWVRNTMKNGYAPNQEWQVREAAPKTWYQDDKGNLTHTPLLSVTQVPQGAVLPSSGEIPTLSSLPQVFAGPDLPDYASMVPKSELPDYDAMVTNAQITEDPAYKWRMEQGTKMANRALASRGLSGGGQAVTTLRDLGSQVAGEEYGNMFNRNQSRYSAALNAALTKYSQNRDAYGAAFDQANTMYGAGKDIYNAGTERALNQYNAGLKGFGLKADLANSQYGRLTDLAKIGQGAAGAINSAAGSFASNAGNIAMQSGTNQANAQLAAGQNKSNLYQSLGQLPMQIGSMAISGGWKPFGG